MRANKPLRYQIAVDGYVHKPAYFITELQDQWLKEIGTAPAWGLYDTKENKYVEDTWENLGLDPKISARICSYRMAINNLCGEIMKTRKYPNK